MQPEYTERLMNPKMECYRETYKDSPRWDGEEDLSEKTVIIYGEQGHGDVLQFARYIPLIAQLKCKIIIHCQEGLKDLLLNQLTGISGWIPKNDGVVVELPKHDFHIPSMSLPFLLGIYEVDVPYIKPPQSDNSFEEFKTNFKVGIAWEGSVEHSNNEERSCPLGIFRKIHNMDKVKLFMCQKKIHLDKFVRGSEDMEVHGCHLNNFLDTAKLINEMDLIISVDTSVMHLAGAMGKKTICLMSYNHDPRWDLDINWYPSVKIIKQQEQGDWRGLMVDLNMHFAMIYEKWKIKTLSL